MVVILLVIIKTSHCLQLEVNENCNQNACKKVCNWQGALQIANGRWCRHFLCHIVSLKFSHLFNPL